jgi:hypothetical protein
MLNIVGIWHWWVMQEDFRPILRELLATHRGLEFLHDTPEFQERYGTDKAVVFWQIVCGIWIDELCVGLLMTWRSSWTTYPQKAHRLSPDVLVGLGLAETVIYRIFFYVNKAGNGQLQLREIKRSNLIAALQQVDEEEDINKVLRWVILPCSLSGHLSRWMHVRVTNLRFCVFLLSLSQQSQNRMYSSYILRHNKSHFWWWQVLLIWALLCYLLQVLGTRFRSWLFDW